VLCRPVATDEITAAYLEAIRGLRRRWPKLSTIDPRAEVENRAG